MLIIQYNMVLTNFAWNHPDKGYAKIQPLTIAFGEGDTTIAYSLDGIYWNSCNNVFSIRANHGCWNGSVWVSVGSGDNWVATSYDGITWIGQDNSILSEGYYVAWNGTVFLAAGKSTTNTNTFAISTDGLSWSAVSSSIFNDSANWVGWTGNVWCAVGSGGNTTATSTSIYGNIWTPTNGGNYMVTDLSSIITDMNLTTYTSSSGITNNAFDNSWNMTTNQPTEWITSNTSYDLNGIPTNCPFSTAINSITNTVSGEFLQISAESPVILQYYLLIFNISGGDALYETPKSWYLLGANSDNPSYWNIIDNYQFSLSTPPSYGPNGYFAVPIVLNNNTTAYQYYKILFTSTFNNGSTYASYNTRVMEVDLFYTNNKTTTINPRIKPFITPNGVSYPIRMKKNLYNFLIYADQTNTQTIPIYGSSYYNTDISCGQGVITGSAYDGTNCIIVSDVETGFNMSYTADFGKNWNNTTITTENIEMQIYGAAFNSNYFIIGGNSTTSSGNVLLYGSSKNGIDTWYPCLNAKKIFTKVWGISSNSGYGYIVPNNSLYLNVGDKLNIITPKTYPSTVKTGDIQMTINLNTYKPSL